MKYDFYKKLQIIILGILLITWFSYYVGEKIKEYQDKKHKKYMENFEIFGEKFPDPPTLDDIKNGIVEKVVQPIKDWGDNTFTKPFTQLYNNAIKMFKDAENFFVKLLHELIDPINNVITGVEDVFKGLGYHFDCGRKASNKGYDLGLKILGVQFNCATTKLKNVFNGSCVFYYFADMIFGVIYFLSVQTPIFLIKNILGLDLHFIIDFIKALVIDPIDMMTTSIMGISITHWSKDVVNKCYLCEGDLGDGSGTQNKSFTEWSNYYKCSNAMINKGIHVMLDSLFNGKYMNDWYHHRSVHDWNNWKGNL